MNYRNIIISVFRNCGTKYSTQTVNLWQWLLFEGSNFDIIKSIRELDNPSEIGSLKKQLPCATISGIFEERQANKIIVHSGLICIDIDAKDNQNINIGTMKELTKTLDYILYSGLSVSGKGVFCLIPLSSPKRHLEHYYALEKDFFDLGIRIDSSCTDLSRLRFLSYDPHPYVNPDVLPYNKFLKESTISKVSISTHKYPIKSMEQQLFNKSVLLNNGDFADQDLSRFFSNVEGDEIIPVYPIYMYRDDEKRASISRLIDSIVIAKVDITALRKDWITVGEVISRYFGESGRELFHIISQFYITEIFHYTYIECNTIYNQILRSKYQYSYERIFEVSRKYGFR